MEKTLGSGAFGKVYRVKHKESGEMYALKIVSKSHVSSSHTLSFDMSAITVIHNIHNVMQDCCIVFRAAVSEC